MINQVTHAVRAMQVFSPLPEDVMPNIMLRVESRQDFGRLACTCKGFYAWSEPWLNSRREAAALSRDPQRLTKLPTWIETQSRHMHPADWEAIPLWDIADEKRSLVDQVRRSMAFGEAALLQPGPAPSATDCNAPHLDFVLFSPRLLADVIEDISVRANERLAANAAFALAGFHPSGEAWQCDVLAGAVVWLKANAEKMSFAVRSTLLANLMWAMHSVMLAQRSPALATHLLEHGLLKSHHVSDSLSFRSSNKGWEDPLLTALVRAARNCLVKAGSAEASAFLFVIHQVVSTLAHMNESAALSVLVRGLTGVMKLMSEVTWTPGSAESAWLHALVQAVRDMPEALADIRGQLIERHFITPGEWEKLLLATQGTSS